MIDNICERLAANIQQTLLTVPEGFHDSFAYTTTGRNLCHPITLWIVAKAVESLNDIVKLVGIDVRLNKGGGVKFQPDVVGFKDDGETPILCVDFESPNSSDARIVRKDVEAYLAWNDKTVPYVIITCLPNRQSPDWELRWTATSQYNSAHVGQREKIRENPFMYWSSFWRSELADKDLSMIRLFNIDGNQICEVRLSPSGVNRPLLASGER